MTLLKKDLNRIQVIIHNFLYLASGGLVSRLLLIVIELIVARSLGVEVFGQFSTALAYTTMMCYFINFGLDIYLVKLMSQQPETRRWVFGNTLFLKLIYAVFIYALMMIIAYRCNYSACTILLIQIFGFYNILLTFQETMAAVFQVAERMGKVAFFRSVQVITSFCLVSVCLEKGVVVISLIYLAVSAIFSVVWLIDTIKICRPQLELRRFTFLIRKSYIFGLSMILFMLNYKLDTIMLSVMRSETEVGYYSAAYKFVDIFIKVPAILSITILPTLYRYTLHNKEKAMGVYNMTVKYLGLFGLPLVAVLYLFSSDFINVLFGPEYNASAGALKILGLSLFLTFMASPASDQLIANNKEVLNLFIYTIVVASNILFNFLLIPEYGIIGASIATLLGQFILCLLFWTILIYQKKRPLLIPELTKTFIATASFAIPAFLLQEKLGLVSGLLLSGVIFGVVIVSVKFFGPDDIRAIKSIVRRKAEI